MANGPRNGASMGDWRGWMARDWGGDDGGGAGRGVSAHWLKTAPGPRDLR
jgi:hypothetical protein